MITRLNFASTAAMMAGAVWACFHFWWFFVGGEGPSRMWFSLLGLATLAFAYALFALSATQRAGSWIKIGLLTAMAGQLTMAFGLFGVTLLSLLVTVMFLFLFVILGEMVTSIGLLLFSIANLSENGLARWNVLPLAMTVLYVPSWMVDPGNLPPAWPSHLTELLAALYGVGWVFLGYRIGQDSSSRAALIVLKQ